MKKILAIFFILTIAVTAFACGGDDGRDMSGSTTSRSSYAGIIPDITDALSSTRRTTQTLESTISSANSTMPIVGTSGSGATMPPSTGGGTTVR